jgi:1,4-dihydroxy-2-naphthoyl-CoA hydrolase
MTDAPQNGFDQTLGFRYGEVSRDRAVIEVDVSPALHQPYGIVHGGVMAALVEGAASTGAAMWLGDRGKVVGVNNSTDFLVAVRGGTLTATATPIHRGRSQQLWAVDITDDQQRRVARGQVRLQNLTSPA